MNFNTIKTDMYAAMKNGDKVRKDVLSTIMANAKNEAIASGANRDNIPDSVIDTVLLREKKLLKEMIEKFPVEENPSAEHVALKESYYKKLEIVMEYAPQVIDDEDEIRAIVTESGVELTKKNMGRIMGLLKGKKCDMSVGSAVVNKMIKEAEGE